MALAQININQLEGKIRSKKDLYTFLVQDCSAYMPPIGSTNIYFFKSVLRGEKDYIKRDKVMVAAVPQIEGLTVEDVLQLFAGKQQLLRHIPDERDWVHIDRKWLCDILFTLDKAGFQAVINNAIMNRKNRLEQSRSMMVEMRPEFAQAFNSCMSFCSGTGRASALLKASSKRKRTKAEIEEVKQEEAMLKQDKQQFLQQVKRLKRDQAELNQVAAMIRNQGVGAMDDDDDEEEQPNQQRFNI